MKSRYAVDDEERRTIPMSFKIKPSHYAILKKRAEKEDRTVTSIIERALVLYFNKSK